MTHYRPLSPPPKRECRTRLLCCLRKKAGADAEIVCTDAEPWASALFDGMRYSITLGVTGSDARERAQALAQSLPEAEFSISGHIVADLAVESQGVIDGDRHVLHLSVLTIAEF